MKKYWKSSKLVLLAFGLHFIVGLFCFDDYGTPWDENINLWKGSVGLSYVYGLLDLYPEPQWNQEGIDGFHSNPARRYGIIFEVFTMGLADLLNIDELANVYLMRHFLVFLCFFSACLIFYYLALDIFSCRITAFLCWFMLVCTPRIFAHSFYNNKDLVFLSAYLVAGWAGWKMLQKPTLGRVGIAGLFAGLAIAVRVMGVLIPVVSLCLLLLYFVNREGRSLRYYLAVFGLFIASVIMATYAFWPYLWEAYWHGFLSAFGEFSNYQFFSAWYFGAYFDEIPWHYSIIWIFLTTPFLIVLLVLLGCFDFANYIFRFKNWLSQLPEIRGRLFVYGLWVGPLTAVVVFKSTLYDGWRHLFFIYPFMVLSAGYGCQRALAFISAKSKNPEKPRKIFFGLLAAYGIIFMIFPLIRLHPLQNVYFSEVIPKSLRVQFDLDSLGLSNKLALQYVLDHSEGEVRIFEGNESCSQNSFMFPADVRSRFKFVTDYEQADWYISTYRWKRNEYNAGEFPFDSVDYEVTADGLVVCVVRKLLPGDAPSSRQ